MRASSAHLPLGRSAPTALQISMNDKTTSAPPVSELQLSREDTLFVVMDVQERLVAAMPDECRSVAVDNVIRLIQGARILSMPLVITEQYPQGLGHTIDPVAQAIAELAPAPVPIDKVDFDGCVDDRFAASLQEAGKDGRKPRSIVLFGMETHICIYQTARALVARGFSVHVPVDACCCRRIENHRIAEQLLVRAGAITTSTETVLFDLLARADSNDFKAINKLVR